MGVFVNRRWDVVGDVFIIVSKISEDPSLDLGFFLELNQMSTLFIADLGSPIYFEILVVSNSVGLRYFFEVLLYYYVV